MYLILIYSVGVEVIKMEKKDNPIFSLDKKNYKALCFFRVYFVLRALDKPTRKASFDFRVPVVKEEDGLFYALCIEGNEVTYGSNSQNAINRMGELLLDFAQMTLDSKTNTDKFDWAEFRNDKMSKKYLDIYNELYEEYDKIQAKKLVEYIQGSNNESIFREDGDPPKNISGRIGDASVEKIYEHLLDVA